jgi:4-amino-4-deoxy-L-arabinose transferase-like glycosyltransferase
MRIPRALAAARQNPVIPLMVVSVALGVVWLVRTQPRLFSDYYDYFRLAGNLLDEQQFGYPNATAKRLPGYPFLLALFMMVSRSTIWLGIVNIVLNAAMIPLVHRFAMSLSGDRRVAIGTASLYALNPTFLFFSPILASEHMFVLLFVSSFLPLYSLRTRPRARVALSGVLIGLAALTRGEALFYLPVVAFAAWITTEGARRLRVLSVVGVVVVCAAVTAPWLIRNRVVMGPGVGFTTTAGINFYFGHNAIHYGYHDLYKAGFEKGPEPERQRMAFRRGLAHVSSAPTEALGAVAIGTRELLVLPGDYAIRAALVLRETRPDGVSDERRDFPWGTRGAVKRFYRAMAILAAFGLLFARRIGWRSMTILYGVIALNWFCYAVVFWSKPRFRFTSEVMMCVLAAYVLCAFWDEWQELLKKRRAQTAGERRS